MREKAKDKNPFIPRILEKLQLAVPQVDSAIIEDQSQKLDMSFRKLEALDTSLKDSQQLLDALADIVITASSPAFGASFAALLDTVPVVNRSGQHDTGSSMRDHVGKVGRYRSATRYLVAAARKLPPFKRITICDVGKISSRLAPWVPATKAGLRNVLDRSSSSLPRPTRCQKMNAFRLESGCSLASDQAGCLFQQRMSTARKTGKVHAEVQLLLYYDVYSANRLPRVISASKIPCYLCSLFVAAHRRFRLQDTHGKLYTSWALPSAEKIGGSDGNVKRYNKILLSLTNTVEKAIAYELNAGRVAPVHPGESVCNLYVWQQSTSTILPVRSVGGAPTTNRGQTIPEDDVRINGNGDVQEAQSEDANNVQQNERPESQGGREQSNRKSSVSNHQSTISRAISKEAFPLTFQHGPCASRSADGAGLNEVSAKPDLEEDDKEPPQEGRQSDLTVPRIHMIKDSTTEASNSMIKHKQQAHGPNETVYKAYPISGSSQSSGPSEVQHVKLSPGQRCSKQLIQGGLPIRVSTPHIRLELSWSDFANPEEHTSEKRGSPLDYSVQAKTCQVSITSLQATPQQPLDLGVRTGIVDLEEQNDSLERVLQEGAAMSSEDLFLTHRTDMVSVKYSFE